MRQFAEEHPAEDKRWFEDSNVISLLVVDDEHKLRSLLDMAAFLKTPCCGFHEPDRGLELTAVALGPSREARRLTRRLGMALG